MLHPFEVLKSEYTNLLATVTLRRDWTPMIDGVVKVGMRNEARYQAVGLKTGIPAAVIMALHMRESSFDFSTHLHNGDPLSRRTTHVPAGRPATGSPPFTWEVSAVDALHHDAMDLVKEWTLERALYQEEAFNGFGPRNRGIHTGYLWSGTNHYVRGKYVADGAWSGTTTDQQVGTVALMLSIAAINPKLALPRVLAPLVLPSETPAPAPVGIGGGTRPVEWMQRVLNATQMAYPLLPDGSYDRKTIAVVKIYQRHRGLESDGFVGPKTLAALEKDALRLSIA